MPEVICEPCYDCKYTDCVTVCPVDCFYQDEKMLYIHPSDCIECEACIPECPVEAIFHNASVPEKWRNYIQLNSERAIAMKAADEGNITTKANTPQEGPECKKRQPVKSPMSETDWLACTNPMLMLKYLAGKASDRKTRLFACAYWRSLSPDPDDKLRKAIDAAERFADGVASAVELAETNLAASETYALVNPYRLAEDDVVSAHLAAVFATARPGAANISSFWDLWSRAHESGDAPGATRAMLLRDIFVYPFRPVMLNPAWLTPTVVSLAHASYHERILPSGHLDPVRLSILADALVDAGCTEEYILSHLRNPGPHVRGCFVLDLLTGK